MRRPSKRLGMTLLSIWVIVTGILLIVSVPIPFIGIIMGIFAVITGLVLLFGR